MQSSLSTFKHKMSKGEGKINREMLMLQKNQARGTRASLNQFDTGKRLIVSIKPTIPDLNAKLCSDSEEEEETVENLTSLTPQAAHHGLPKLLFDLEVEIFARASCFQYWKLNFLNKQFSQLLQSREIFRVRRERGLVQPYVLMFWSGETCWAMFDKGFKNFRQLPEIPSDFCFFSGDKETITAGTHLIVIGREEQRIVVWRYELEINKWIKDTEMITPRVMYASASRGTDAFFAGGIKTGEKGVSNVVNIAERYNSDTKTWKAMKAMHKRRKFSSGCFLRGKFYALGGRDENDVYLTCGESYDETTDSWKLIPNMLKGMTFMNPQSPPLIAVVKDNLYLLETWLNELWVYDINANAWKSLGVVPVKANAALGWGVAFKSVGDRLLVIGASATQSWDNNTMSVYTCCPSPKVEKIIWEETRCDGVKLSHFIRNCCVMLA
ncbi:Kelch repeat type 1 [Arabidopsis thaliana x Arabidopsis arenosa]|uniref:Kelch repeat type 1 n=1 Tax=Arabidopsis thaliana x Arabidopsis arenosa TaxID=1240361 RepID=A0A8T1YDR2_9BRAS|nr:Kelch repeat type 1 [Arabidopsis thaliana x Arabidopsis arenosa]